MKNWDIRKINRFMNMVEQGKNDHQISEATGLTLGKIRSVKTRLKIGEFKEPVPEHEPHTVERDWSPKQREEFCDMVLRGMPHYIIAKHVGISPKTVTFVRRRLMGLHDAVKAPERKKDDKTYVPPTRDFWVVENKKRLVAARSKPKSEKASQRQQRKCLACGDTFMSRDFGHRTCGCNDYKSVSLQELYA